MSIWEYNQFEVVNCIRFTHISWKDGSPGITEVKSRDKEEKWCNNEDKQEWISGSRNRSEPTEKEWWNMCNLGEWWHSFLQTY